jgi:hypothetical protein
MKSVGHRIGAGDLGAFVFLLAAHIARIPDLPTIALDGYDDLFQLALGLKTAHGAWPGLDFFTNYGPGVSVVSALSWQTANPILADVLLGTWLLSIGSYAFWRAGRIAGRPAHNGFLLLCLVFLAPGWAKYYYALWPGLFLLTLGDPAADRPPAAQHLRWFLLGCITGTGAWFRLEIGLALTAATGGALFLRRRAGATEPTAFALAVRTLAGCVIPWLIYFGAAWAGRGRCDGPGDLIDFYFASTQAKTVDFHWASAVPRIAGFFSAESLTGSFGLGFAFGSAAILGLFFPRSSNGLGAAPAARRAWCAACLLLCLFPQCLHRFDAIHILQVVGAGCVAVSLGLAVVGEAPDRGRFPLEARHRLIVMALLLLLAGRAYWKATPHATEAVPRLRTLVAGLDALDQSTPDLQLVRFVQSHTPRGEAILIPSIDTRFYALTGRPFAGLFPHWAFHLPERWQQRQVAALQKTPAPLLLHADYYRGPEAKDFLRPLDFKGRNPQIDAFTTAYYPAVVYSAAGWRVLARGSP